MKQFGNYFACTYIKPNILKGIYIMQYIDLYESKTNFIKSFGVRILPVLESANINFKDIDKNSTPNIPARCINKPKLLFDLHSGKKSETSPIIMK